MNEYELFLQLLQKSIYPSKPLSINIQSDINYQKIYQLADIHHVLPLIHEQFIKNKDILEIKDDDITKWKRQTINTVLIQENATSIFLELYQKMCDRGILALVVKGIVLRNLYTHPNYRISTDEDIWIHKNQVKECEMFLLSQGYKKETYSSEDTLSFTHEKTYFHLEVHITPFSSKGPYSLMNNMFIHCFENYKKIKIQNVDIYTLNDTDHYLYLIAHTYQHFMSCGVGIRQLIDIVLYQDMYSEFIHFDQIEKQLKIYGLDSFYRVMADFCKMYIQDDIHISLEKKMYIDLLEDIMRGGVYGKSSSTRISSSNVIHAQMNGSSSRVQRWYKILFPSKKLLIQRYSWLKYGSLLLPFAWIHRWYQFLERNHFQFHILADSLNIGEDRLTLAKKYNFL